jgi:hypothetical protein
MARTPARSSNPNPLPVDPGREQRIRERAYHLWEAEGKPHGRDVEYWERARELIDIEDSAVSRKLPDPPTQSASPRDTSIEEPASQSRPGVFPDRPAGQGEVKPTPAPKRRARAKPKKPV